MDRKNHYIIDFEREQKNSLFVLILTYGGLALAAAGATFGVHRAWRSLLSHQPAEAIVMQRERLLDYQSNSLNEQQLQQLQQKITEAFNRSSSSSNDDDIYDQFKIVELRKHFYPVCTNLNQTRLQFAEGVFQRLPKNLKKDFRIYMDASDSTHVYHMRRLKNLYQISENINQASRTYLNVLQQNLNNKILIYFNIANEYYLSGQETQSNLESELRSIETSIQDSQEKISMFLDNFNKLTIKDLLLLHSKFVFDRALESYDRLAAQQQPEGHQAAGPSEASIQDVQETQAKAQAKASAEAQAESSVNRTVTQTNSRVWKWVKIGFISGTVFGVSVLLGVRLR